jgi:hypothetical protein
MLRAMLDLDSPRWAELATAGGNPSLLVGLLRSLREDPTEEDWEEAWEQVAHQFTRSSAAYAALPHLLRLGVEQGLATDPDFLFNMGRVAAPFEVEAPVPEDLRADYEAALAEARTLALQAAAAPGRYDADAYANVLYAAAALSGRTRLAVGWISLAMSRMPEEVELDCPGCGASLLGPISKDGLVLEAVDAHARPISGLSLVEPREASSTRWDLERPPEEDFEWLTALCLAAGQEELIAVFRQLYGKTACPVCQAPFLVMNEVERSHDRGG